MCVCVCVCVYIYIYIVFCINLRSVEYIDTSEILYSSPKYEKSGDFIYKFPSVIFLGLILKY